MATPKKGRGRWLDAFLGALAATASVARAARAARVSRQEAYKRSGRDPAFAAAWKLALAEAVERMADEARRRAVERTLKPIFQGDKKVGQVREYSDTLLIFLLKAHGGPAYREANRVTVAGDTAAPVKRAPAESVFDRIDQLAELFAGDRPVLDPAAVRGFLADVAGGAGGAEPPPAR